RLRCPDASPRKTPFRGMTPKRLCGKCEVPAPPHTGAASPVCGSLRRRASRFLETSYCEWRFDDGAVRSELHPHGAAIVPVADRLDEVRPLIVQADAGLRRDARREAFLPDEPEVRWPSELL